MVTSLCTALHCVLTYMTCNMYVFQVVLNDIEVTINNIMKLTKSLQVYEHHNSLHLIILLVTGRGFQVDCTSWWINR